MFQCVEAAIVQPRPLPCHLRQCSPLRIGEAGDGDPAILPRATIRPMGRRRLVGRAIAVAPPHTLVGRPIENRRPGQEQSGFTLRCVDPLTLAGTLAMIQRAEQRERVAVGAHPVEKRVAPADGHRRLRQPRHVALPAERRGNRTNGAHPPIRAVHAHAGLLDVDDVRSDALHHVIAKPKALQHAGRKPFGHDIADPHQILGDLQTLWMADVQRDAAFAGVLVVELPAHVRVSHSWQRSSCDITCRTAADRCHRGKARIGIVLPFDLVAFRTHRGEESRAAGRGQEPREVEDLHALQRKRLVVQRRQSWACRAARLRRHARPPRCFAQDRCRVLAQQRCSPSDLPAGLWCSATCWSDSGSCVHAPDDTRRRSSCVSASVRRAHSHAACAAAPIADRHPVPRATACRHRSRRG